MGTDAFSPEKNKSKLFLVVKSSGLLFAGLTLKNFGAFFAGTVKFSDSLGTFDSMNLFWKSHFPGPSCLKAD